MSSAKMLIPLSTPALICLPMTMTTLTTGSILNAVTPSAVNSPSVSEDLRWGAVPAAHKYVFPQIWPSPFIGNWNLYNGIQPSSTPQFLSTCLVWSDYDLRLTFETCHRAERICFLVQISLRLLDLPHQIISAWILCCYTVCVGVDCRLCRNF